jgi:predicted TIM-barrel fold metal-dependent hydrolase
MTLKATQGRFQDGAGAVDVHQHLWPPELIDRLRARCRPPYLRGWRLVTDGEPPLEVDPGHHDVDSRSASDREAGIALSCVSLSAPLGIEALPRPESASLLNAWHTGAAKLSEQFAPWASAPSMDPDLDELERMLAHRFIGLQLPASDLLSPAAWERAAPLLHIAEEAQRPVLVHPGAERRPVLAGKLPAWWPAVVGYVSQMQAAWWGWHEASMRASFPELRVIFAAGAGLAPVHHERYAARGGTGRSHDPKLFVDTSSYGPQAVDALVRVLGVDALVLGSDRPYAEPTDVMAGPAASYAVRHVNPRWALGIHTMAGKEPRRWPRAS